MTQAGGQGSSEAVRQFTVERDDDGARLDRWFKRHLPDLPFALVSRWARTGQVRLDGRRVAPGDRIEAGQVIRIPPSGPAADHRTPGSRPEVSDEEADFARSLVIHRDRAAIVINKPPGLATQGGSGTHRHVDRLLDALHFEQKARPRLVHRLDKDTSGVLLLARTPGSAAFFSKRFSGRTARKVYWALVMGVPEISDGMIELPLAKQPGSGGEKMHVDEANGQSARTRMRIVERAGNAACWVELQPLTGRTHQLRVHMAAIGHPIVGDGKYGGKDAFLTGAVSRKMHLHARRLRIEHPDGAPLDVTADLPEHFMETMDHLGFDLTLGDLPLTDKAPTPSPRAEKAHARAHAQQVRKARRGERRSRESPPARKPRSSGRGRQQSRDKR